MNIGEAVAALKAVKKVRRPHWGIESYLRLHQDVDDWAVLVRYSKTMIPPKQYEDGSYHAIMPTFKNSRSLYTNLHLDDVLADDWEVVED